MIRSIFHYQSFALHFFKISQSHLLKGLAQQNVSTSPHKAKTFSLLRAHSCSDTFPKSHWNSFFFSECLWIWALQWSAGGTRCKHILLSSALTAAFFPQGHKHVWQRGLVLLCLFVWWPPFSVLLPESRVHTEIKSWRLALSDWFLFVFCMVWSYLIFLLAFIRQPAETSCQE